MSDLQIVHTNDCVPVIRCRDCARAELRGVQIEGEPDAAVLYCREWLETVRAEEYCSRGIARDGQEKD